ncbi:hypothetical protein E1B28_005700 [Marasmius oreades]|uniref:Uncharacterized protein n=1 Tax=Marasmius oreades TaxID=181124 RepID=A0A9P7UUU7_9AGAR|nr:uncharacterized protein E1B28_005700 [Marasmius oreades]KAG7094893.1 hypothetical protein E1B28_005700 [Marasmius oreades]
MLTQDQATIGLSNLRMVQEMPSNHHSDAFSSWSASRPTVFLVLRLHYPAVDRLPGQLRACNSKELILWLLQLPSLFQDTVLATHEEQSLTAIFHYNNGNRRS